MKILLTLALVAVLSISAHANCQRTETTETFLRIVEVCEKMPPLTRLATPVLGDACSELESSAAIIGARIAAGGPGTCTKAYKAMTEAIMAFRVAVNKPDSR